MIWVQSGAFSLILVRLHVNCQVIKIQIDELDQLVLNRRIEMLDWLVALLSSVTQIDDQSTLSQVSMCLHDV